MYNFNTTNSDMLWFIFVIFSICFQLIYYPIKKIGSILLKLFKNIIEWYRIEEQPKNLNLNATVEPAYIINIEENFDE